MDRSAAYLLGVIGIVFVSPFLLGAANHFPWMNLVVAGICSLSIFLMYSMPGYPLFRFPVFLLGATIT